MRLLELMVLDIPLLIVHLLGGNSTPFICLFPSLAAFTHSLNSYLNLNFCLSSVYGSMFSRTTCPQCSTWQHIGKVCCSHILGCRWCVGRITLCTSAGMAGYAHVTGQRMDKQVAHASCCQCLRITSIPLLLSLCRSKIT